ncbi:helix-turn-helix domain-containing protein [Bacteroides nordii]|uniref:helix-turn-helix domain-containing protein n=1 Tax=Bacteroides nordii TaxID=291645 RepID=UPI0021E6B00B|nr:AraC family transcriptional regulator [Bacteroides nordii]
MVLCIVAGVISNGSLHIGPMLYVADAIHFFTLLYYTWAPLRELGNVQRRLDSEHGNPADAYLRTTRFGFFVVCAFAVISPLYILSRPLLFVFGPLGLISLSLFIVSFTAFGFSMSEGVTEIVTETNDEIAAAKVFREIGPERIAEIDMAVSKWRSEGGFRDSNLTLSSFARRIMVNRTDVASYLTSIYGKNFRTWLSGIRVEEAKALMAAHPEYSNEVVSMECGFSSRVYFQRLFKERTGLTPAEWHRQR